MARAVCSIPPTEDGDTRPTCLNCLGELSDHALRCQNCKAYEHLNCSRLPEFQLIRFSVTQASYMCSKCVESKEFGGDADKFSNEVTKIRLIIGKEKSIIQVAEDEANKTTEDPILIRLVEEDASARKTEGKNITPCRYYLRQGCKHGRKGANCHYSHPKLCFKFIKHGDMRGGCKEGDKCQYMHPKLCNSYKSGVCSRDKCNFFHVKGTKVKTKGDEIPLAKNITRTVSENKPKSSEYQREVGTTAARPRIVQHDSNQANPAPLNSNQQYVSQRDFLELQVQLKIIQEQLLQLTASRQMQPQPDRVLQRTSAWGM